MYGKIAIVYDGSRADFEKMAEAVAEGVKEANGEPDLFTAEEFNTYMPYSYSGIAVGLPMFEKGKDLDTKMGRLYNALKPRLQGKRVGLFTSRDGDENWLPHIERDIRGAGVILESESILADGEPTDDILDQCRRLGREIV